MKTPHNSYNSYFTTNELWVLYDRVDHNNNKNNYTRIECARSFDLAYIYGGHRHKVRCVSLHIFLFARGGCYVANLMPPVRPPGHAPIFALCTQMPNTTMRCRRRHLRRRPHIGDDRNARLPVSLCRLVLIYDTSGCVLCAVNLGSSTCPRMPSVQAHKHARTDTHTHTSTCIYSERHEWDHGFSSVMTTMTTPTTIKRLIIQSICTINAHICELYIYIWIPGRERARSHTHTHLCKKGGKHNCI